MEAESVGGGSLGGRGPSIWLDIAGWCVTIAPICLWASSAWWWAQPGGGFEFLHPDMFALWKSRAVAIGIPVGAVILVGQALLLARSDSGNRRWRGIAQLAAFATAFWVVAVVGGGVLSRILNLAPAPARYAKFYGEFRVRYPGQPPLLLLQRR